MTHNCLWHHTFYYLTIQTFIYLYKAIIFTTILFTPHKDITHGSSQLNCQLSYLHTPTHGNTPTIATLFFSLHLTTPQNGSWWYLQHDETPQKAMKINTHPRTAQHTNMLPTYSQHVISESQFTFLTEVCFDPIIYFSMIYATTWHFLWVNYQLIFTPSLPID